MFGYSARIYTYADSFLMRENTSFLFRDISKISLMGSKKFRSRKLTQLFADSGKKFRKSKTFSKKKLGRYAFSKINYKFHFIQTSKKFSFFNFPENLRGGTYSVSTYRDQVLLAQVGTYISSSLCLVVNSWTGQAGQRY